MDKKKNTNQGKWNDGHFVPVNPEFIEFVNRPITKASVYDSLQPKGSRAKKNADSIYTHTPPEKK